jgi:hypothetical protein
MTKKLSDPIANHLEFLGYDTRTTPDGWTYCEHPKRFNVFYRTFPYGWRIHASFYLGRFLGDSRPSFLEAINAMNEKSVLAKFSLNKDSDGDFSIRARAVFQGEYRKQAFGLFMDVWHSDLELLSELPQVPEQEEKDKESEEQDAAETRLPN